MPRKRSTADGNANRPISVAVGAVVRELRTEQEISQDSLADRTHLHRNYIGRVERGTLNPTLDNLNRVARELGLPLSDLIARAEQLG